MANTLDTIQPYVEQLFDDDDVRRQLARATANLRGAKQRAGRKRGAKRKLQDEHLRHRLAAAAQAAFAAGLAIKEGPERRQRRHRRSAFLGLALLAAGMYVALDAGAREKALSLIPTSQEGER